jgi:hypothetical protein
LESQAMVTPEPKAGEIVSRCAGFRDAWGAFIHEGDQVWAPYLGREGVIRFFDDSWWVCYGGGQRNCLYDELAARLEVAKGARNV